MVTNNVATPVVVAIAIGGTSYDGVNVTRHGFTALSSRAWRRFGDVGVYDVITAMT